MASGKEVVNSGLSIEEDREWQLTPQYVEVFFSPYGEHDVTQGYDFLVFVQATFQPERQQRLKSVCTYISARIRAEVHPGLRFGVWIQLVNAEWKEALTARRS